MRHDPMRASPSRQTPIILLPTVVRKASRSHVKALYQLTTLTSYTQYSAQSTSFIVPRHPVHNILDLASFSLCLSPTSESRIVVYAVSFLLLSFSYTMPSTTRCDTYSHLCDTILS